MALKVEINKSKEVALWKEFKDQEENTLARFKVRGIEYKPYQVAIERANNQIASKGYNVATASTEDKLYHELLLEAAACHLIADWDGVVFVEDDQEVEPTYSPENATKLLNMGDMGLVIWAFVKTTAEQIQAEANQRKADIVGKLSNSTNGTVRTRAKQNTKESS